MKKILAATGILTGLGLLVSNPEFPVNDIGQLLTSPEAHILAATAEAQQNKQKYPTVKLGYELKIVPDDPNDFEPEEAKKSLAVALYILTTKDDRFKREEIKIEGMNVVQAIMDIENFIYIVTPSSIKPGHIIDPKYKMPKLPDSLGMRIVAKGLESSPALFGDYGFDAVPNYAFIPANHPLNPTGQLIDYVRNSRPVSKDTLEVIKKIFRDALTKIVVTYGN